MKKLLIGIAILAGLMISYLFVFSLVSTSHQIAKLAIEQSKAVEKSAGSLKAIALIGVRQKLVPGNISCTSSTYVVFGNSGFEFVSVNMSMRAGDRDWILDDLSLGWFGKSAASC
jgi:hypothetical protein